MQSKMNWTFSELVSKFHAKIILDEIYSILPRTFFIPTISYELLTASILSKIFLIHHRSV